MESVRKAKHMDGFTKVISDALAHTSPNIIIRTNCELPGFYRPSKRWDLAIYSADTLIAAIEYKSQIGSSRKNFNNRIEEAVGSAYDLRRAAEKGKFSHKNLWLGYLFLMEECEETTRSVNGRMSVYNNYKESLGVLGEGLYDSTSLLLTSEKSCDIIYGREEFDRFTKNLTNHVEKSMVGSSC